MEDQFEALSESMERDYRRYPHPLNTEGENG